LAWYCYAFALTPYWLKQTGTIAGKIIDNNQEPVSFANVILKSAADSSLVKVEYTHDDGTFQMINITPGEYWGYCQLCRAESLQDGSLPVGRRSEYRDAYHQHENNRH
jgi:predicted ATP-grasp superfamily ATP-dependent carboligase